MHRSPIIPLAGRFILHYLHPSMICRQDHLPIAYSAPACPLCHALTQLEAAEADRDYARDEAANKQADLEQAYFDRYGN